MKYFAIRNFLIMYHGKLAIGQKTCYAPGIQKGINNMKKAYLILLTVMCLLSGCAYTRIQIPMDKDFDNTQLGIKQGEASSRTVLYLVSWGNAGTRQAAENGNIKVIKHADRKIFSVLFGLYTKLTTVVYGD